VIVEVIATAALGFSRLVRLARLVSIAGKSPTKNAA
jgi:hypothetical protein